jgi:hypothetical protein
MNMHAAIIRILVVGVAGNLTDRRVFDDLFAKALNEAGVERSAVFLVKTTA